jgi:hypothetical protein
MNWPILSKLSSMKSKRQNQRPVNSKKHQNNSNDESIHLTGSNRLIDSIHSFNHHLPVAVTGSPFGRFSVFVARENREISNH